jgi:hypothetical protein
VLPLALSLHVDTSGDLDPWIVAAGAVLVLGIIGTWWSGNRRSRARLDRVTSKKRDALLEGIERRNRTTMIAVVSVIVLTVVGVFVFRPEETSTSEQASTSEEASGRPVSTSSPDPQDDFPITFNDAFEDGAFNATVGNRTDDEVYVQCQVDALDSSGASVLDDEWTAYEQDGSKTKSDLYTTGFDLAADSEVELDIAELSISGPVARYEGECEEIREPPETSSA